MIELSREEGFLTYWVFSIDGFPYAKLRQVVGTRAIIKEALQQAEGAKDEERVDAVLLKLARSYGFKLLSRQAYHSQALKLKMKQAGLSKVACDAAARFLQEKGYLDDDAYVRGRVRSWKAVGKSQRDIGFRLKKMGVSSTEEMTDDESLRICLTKKYPKWQILLQDRKSKMKLIAALMRRGFSSDAIFDCFGKFE